jgi:hypothetical protein
MPARTTQQPNMPDFSDRDFPALPTAKTKLSRKTTTMVGNEGGLVATRSFATIKDLPVELHLSILRYLTGIDLEDFQLAPLISLSRTNRHFCRLVTEKIYASYDSHFCKPYLFLRTVISNTYLASLVKHANFAYGLHAHSERQRYTANAQDKKVIKEGLKMLGIPGWKNLATQCNTDPVELDILYTTILTQTPNISTLCIDVSGSLSYKWIDLFRKANLGASDLGRIHRFEHLQTLRINSYKPRLNLLAPVFQIPSLRKLYLSGLFEYENAQHLAGRTQALQKIIPQCCNSLEELHIEFCFLQNEILRVVLASAHSLKAFSYDLSMNAPSYDVDEADLRSTTLIAALECQQTALETLSYTDDLGPEESFYKVNNLFDGLKDFSAMKHLSCSLDSILDENSKKDWALAEKLPPSLITFHVHTATPLNENKAMELFLALEQVATNSAHHTPLLGKVHIKADHGARFDRHDWSRVVAAFSRTDIDFTIEQSPWDGDWSEGSVYGHTLATNHPTSDTESSESSGEVSLYSN